MTIDEHIAAGIDLGSNTFRLLVAACLPDGIRVLEKKLVTVRLGRGLAQNKLLQAQAMEKGLEVLRSFRRDLDRHRPLSLRVCGTEALRQAENNRIFLRQAEQILQTEIEIISGWEEASLSLAGALPNREHASGAYLLADVGGGSTELIITDPTTGQTEAESIGLGVVGLTEKFMTEPRYDVGSMDAFLADELAKVLAKLKIPADIHSVTVIGSGGTATSLAALDLDLGSYEESLVHGHLLEADSLERLWNRLVSIPATSRNAIPCLEDGRGEILPAGLRVYQTLLRLLHQERIRISDKGLLEGILLSSIPDL